MFRTALLASLISWLLPQQSTPALDPAWTIEVTTPTYRTDGSVAGASTGVGSLVINQPLVLYAGSGKSLCASGSATRTPEADAGNGWRIQMVPLRNDGGLVLQVNWERMWERGTRLTNGPHGKAQVTLRPGSRIVFDYISVGGRALSPNMAAEARQVTGDGCDAVGMGLELGLAPIERREIIEANLWLVRTLPDGSEQSQRQTIRARAGSAAEYFFDDVTMSGAPVVAPGATPDRSQRDFYFFNASVRTVGKLSSIDVANGKVKMDVTIEQYMPNPLRPNQRTGGSATFSLNAGPDEVTSLRVPKVTEDRLALRIQVKQIR